MAAKQGQSIVTCVTVPALLIVFATGCARRVEVETVAPMMAPVEGPTGRLHFDDGGSGGLPVVFVHSFAGNSGHWSSQLAHLRQERRAIAIDLRGHGQSDPPRSGDFAVSALAEDLATVVDRLNLHRFILVGHSMGGVAAVEYAGAHPERVMGLVLVGTPGKSSPEMANKVLTSMNANYDAVSEGYWKSLLAGAQPNVESQIRSEIQRLPRESALAIIASIFAYDPLPALSAYDGPKLLVDTSHGDGADALHKQAPGVPRLVISGTSHWPHMDKPEEFNRLLDAFLAKFR